MTDLPPLPEPYKPPPNMFCTACKKPYIQPMFLANKYASACPCGSNSFDVTIAYAPGAQYTAEQMQAYTRDAVAADRELVTTLVEECRAALSEELSAWDIDPPIYHVKQAHDKCVAWLAAAIRGTP